jgi:hypothetical protein
MTAYEFALQVSARRTGAGRWQAKCPAHPDLNPSLSIAEGRDGRTLVHCWAGCALDAVLAAMGLSMSDLFVGRPPSPAQARQLATGRARRDAETQARRQESRSECDHVRKLSAVVDALGDRLAQLSDDDAPGADAAARLFHHSLAQLRNEEMALVVTR